MSILFKTAGSPDIALLIIRVGMAFPFIFASQGKFTPAGAMRWFTGLGVDPITFGLIFGALELLSGIFLIFGLLTRLAALWQAIVLISAMAFFKFSWMQGPAIWKDPALLAVSVALIIRGAGKYSADHYLSRKGKR